MDRKEKRILVAKRIARELKDGDVVNLGIGIPTEVANHIPADKQVCIQSENGVIGVGPAPLNKEDVDPNLVNAGGVPITIAPGASFVDSVDSFGIIRGGHLSMTVLGALEVDQEGSIANWMIPGKMTVGMGGAMDLLVGAKKVVAATEHLDKKGNPKILKKCTLPLSAYRKVTWIVTDMAFIEVVPQGLHLKEIASWTTLEDVLKATDADLIYDENNLGTFSL
jgi:acetate CoA/acetoacetate CoA-transferase beta subunit